MTEFAPHIIILLVISTAGYVEFSSKKARHTYHDVRSRSAALDAASPAADTCGGHFQFPRPTQVAFPPIRGPINPHNKIPKGARLSRYDGCLRYEVADHDAEHCQDPFAPTDYDGPNPPCRQHVLRDMAKAVDDAMCDLGLEYTVAYGTLLGLVRDGHIVPWTSDNDYVVDFRVAEKMWAQRDYFQKRSGLKVVYDFYLRLCVAENFMDGALLRWKTTKYDKDKELSSGSRFAGRFPYADFYYGGVHPGLDQFVDERGCGYDLDRYLPLQRMAVYNSNFYVNVPNNYLEVLDTAFGAKWKTPHESKSKNSKTVCKAKGMEKFIRNWSVTGYDHDWTKNWNEILKEHENNAVGGDAAAVPFEG